MLLAIDIGNTNITIGGIKDDQIFHMDIHSALKVEHEVNNNLFNLANVLSM